MMTAVTNNTTIPTQMPEWVTPSVTQTSLFFGLAVVTIFGNALVIGAVYRDPYKNLRTISNYLVVNLAVADLLVGLVSETLWGLTLWVHSRKFFEIANATMYLSLVASSLTVLGMSIERYIVIKSSLTWKTVLTPRRLKFFIALIWTVSLFMALLPTMGVPHKHVTLILMDTTGVPTLILMTIIYILVFRILRKSAYRDIKRGSINQNSESQAALRSRLREKEVAKTICVVVVVFAICWLPSFISEHVVRFCPQCLSQKWNNLLNVFGLMNSFCNPIIYAIKMPKFRAAIKFLFRCGHMQTKKCGMKHLESTSSSTIWYL